MYCHNCGQKAFGNFCSHCGTKLITPEVTDSAGSVAAPHWSLEKNYTQLINYPDVRNLIAGYAEQSSKKLTAEEFLGLIDIVFKPVSGISLAKMTDLLVSIYGKMGIKTGKKAKRSFELPISEVIVKALCSLAKNGYPVKTVEQAVNGLAIIAKIPSDMWTWGGDLIITIEDMDSTTLVGIHVKIKGQLMDWGKSKKVIRKIMADIEGIPLP